MFFIKTWNARLEHIQVRTLLVALAEARCKFDVFVLSLDTACRAISILALADLRYKNNAHSREKVSCAEQVV